MSSAAARSALWYLWRATTRNVLRAQRARLRQPRYVVAFLLGGAYLFWVFRLGADDADSPFAALAIPGVAPTLVSALLLVLAVRWWLARPDRTALAFTPAEVHLLFPAPVSRRTLVHTKLMRAQAAILLNVLIWVIILRGGGASIDGWQRGIALWILFSTFFLHRLAAALVRLNAVQHHGAGWRRAALPASVFLAMFGTVGTVLWNARHAIGAAWATGPRAAVAALYDALQHPAAAVVLAPVRALVAPAFAPDPASWLRALGPALLVFAPHYLWVVRTDAAFEEAALEASQERARALAALSGRQIAAKRSKQGAVARVFPLPPRGHPAFLIAWKNAAAAIRDGGWLRQTLMFVLGFAALQLLFRVIVRDMPAEGVFALTAAWGMMLLLLGPLWTRYDLRLDLRDLATIRTLPLSGRAIVTASIVGVALLHTITVLAFLAVPVLILAFDPGGSVTELIDAPWATGVATALAVLAANLITFTVQNGLALLYPAWVALGPDRRGFEAAGQMMLTLGITMLGAALALVFPVLLGGVVAFIGDTWLDTWSLPLGAAIGLLVLLAELVPLWFALGGVFDRTEPGDVPGQRT